MTDEAVTDDPFEEYPEAKPFADLIVADTPDGVREMARTISERMRSLRGQAAESAPAPAPAQEEPERWPGAPLDHSWKGPRQPREPKDPGRYAERPDPERVARAIKNRDFAAFLRAKQGDPEPDE